MSTAVLFQNMPPLSREEYEALETSIREHGIQVPIVVDENRVVIDGHHRQKIAQELGVECPKRVIFDKSDAEKRTLALSLNLDRRHLNREQRRALIAESIKADPQMSNRQHAERLGASHVTVGTVRTELESTGQIDQSETRLSADGRARPASQPPRPSESDLMLGDTWSPDDTPPFDPATGEVLDSPTLTDEPGRVVKLTGPNSVSSPGHIVGLDGKQYTRPEPAKPRRRPITDDARTAGLELHKAIDRLERLTADDRFNRQKEEVASHLRGHLSHAIHVCQDLLDRIN